MSPRLPLFLSAAALLLGCAGFVMPSDAELAACTAYVDSGAMPIWPPEKVVDGNLRALQAEDTTCAMGALHPTSDAVMATWTTNKQLVDQYDLTFTLEEVEVTIEGDTARVEYVQVSRNTNGAPYRDSRVSGVHQMAKNDEGRWRLLATELTSIDYL